MRFPLDEQIVAGYNYGVPTSYSDKHLGVDWQAVYAPLMAPKSGKILNIVTGVEGGKTIHFRPDGETTIIRWLHLEKYFVKKGQLVKEGQVIAQTGNTGSQTTGPHLHEDIWKGRITYKFEDTINPHIYYAMGEQSMNLVEYNTTYYLEGNTGYFGINGVEYLNMLLKIVSADKIQHRPPNGVQLGLVETATQAFLIKDK